MILLLMLVIPALLGIALGMMRGRKVGPLPLAGSIWFSLVVVVVLATGLVPGNTHGDPTPLLGIAILGWGIPISVVSWLLSHLFVRQNIGTKE